MVSNCIRSTLMEVIRLHGPMMRTYKGLIPGLCILLVIRSAVPGHRRLSPSMGKVRERPGTRERSVVVLGGNFVIKVPRLA
uniref:Uncharacterized protein n=1 Tax=Pyxicephalus adspersus TaxID=30357 RepID=A0AAV3B3R3_PYXAD|nr:TPA: hypothetical protein GDO54_007683 [Pyxicephalus adspersus]